MCAFHMTEFVLMATHFGCMCFAATWRQVHCKFRLLPKPGCKGIGFRQMSLNIYIFYYMSAGFVANFGNLNIDIFLEVQDKNI